MIFLNIFKFTKSFKGGRVLYLGAQFSKNACSYEGGGKGEGEKRGKRRGDFTDGYDAPP